MSEVEGEISKPALQEFFGPNLLPLILQKSTSYEAFPSAIPLRGSLFIDWIRQFKSQVDASIIRDVKEEKHAFRREHKLHTNEKEPRPSPEWYREYSQDIYDNNGKIKIGELIRGVLGGVSGGYGDKERLVSMHSHPSDISFSQGDLLKIFVNLAVHEDEPHLEIHAVSTDSGWFLIVPSNETLQAISGMQLGQDKQESFRESNQRIWQNLEQQYTLDHLYGQSLRYKTKDRPATLRDLRLVEDGLNDDGLAMQQLAHMLEMGEKYKFGLYYCAKENDTFIRITGVEDRYPELAKFRKPA